MLEHNHTICEKMPLITLDCMQEASSSEKNKDVSIEINTDDGIPSALTQIPQNVMDIIASHVAYTNGLANLSQTAKVMKKLIDNTPAGKMALKTHHFDMSHFRKCHLKINKKINKSLIDSGCCIGGLVGGIIGLSLYLLLAFNKSPVLCFDRYTHQPVDDCLPSGWCFDHDGVSRSCSNDKSSHNVYMGLFYIVPAVIMGACFTPCFGNVFTFFSKTATQKTQTMLNKQNEIREKLKKPLHVKEM